jgi:hypothetical protein
MEFPGHHCIAVVFGGPKRLRQAQWGEAREGVARM